MKHKVVIVWGDFNKPYKTKDGKEYYDFVLEQACPEEINCDCCKEDSFWIEEVSQ